MISPRQLLGAPSLSGSRLLLFDLLLFALLVLASRLGAALHEGVGHALLGALVGGSILDVQVDLFGGGSARVVFAAQPGLGATLAWKGGGLVVNLVTGAVARGLVPRLYGRPTLALGVALFAIISLVTPLAYSALGFYYGVGDPETLATAHLHGIRRWVAQAGPWDGHYLWVPFLVAMPLAGYWVAGPYLRLQQTWLPSRHLFGRLGVAALTIGLVGVVYLGLYISSRGHLVAFDAPRLAAEDAELRARQGKVLATFERLRAQSPRASEKEIWQMVRAELKRRPVVVRPEELRPRLPLQPLVILLLLVGGILAAARERAPVEDQREPSLTPARVLGLLLAAGSVLAALALLR